jgi:Cys-tRNA(Pro) deacylase
MSKNDYPVTPAIRFLRQKEVPFDTYEYEYIDKGGTRQTAEELNVSEHNVIKTLVMEADGTPIIVLMHGDCEVSTKELARIIGVKKVEPAKLENATKYTGYIFGGTSPFGTKRQMKTYIEESIMTLDKIYINGGKRGFILGISPEYLKLLDYELVNVAIKK